jgi:6-pyruvoyltetrahydropterin/6-carboxytetrahydropterin synthase
MSDIRPMYYSTKNYPPSSGFSCVFRQWQADSHCKFLHGYALGFRFKFAAKHLDKNGWVMDFGGLKALKEALVERFDHRLVIAEDDPFLMDLKALHHMKAADVFVMHKVGCEAFARHMFGVASELLDTDRVRVVSCECYEHEGNSAIYEEHDAESR